MFSLCLRLVPLR